MNFNEPLPGEMEPLPGEFDDVEGGDDLSSAAQSIVDGIAAMIGLQQQTLQMLGVLAQQIGAGATLKRRVVRDAAGRVVGSEPVIEG